MKQKHPKKIMKNFPVSPSPNHKMDRGIHARGGIGRINSKIGLKIASKVLEYPIPTPRAMPAIVAKKKATATGTD